ncbi:hypothetical protein FHW88_005009 [Mucilaginibacter sp. SG538B]|nr:hypothetical protein [Mucilaginibacter sp. SG538B]
MTTQRYNAGVLLFNTFQMALPGIGKLTPFVLPLTPAS